MTRPLPDVEQRSQALKARFVEQHGYWREDLEPLLAKVPDLFEAFCGFSSASHATTTLEPAVRELILLAVNASATHLHAPAIRVYIRNALALGVPEAQILEVFEIVSVLGVHTVSVGLPAVLSAAETVGVPVELPALTSEQAIARDEFVRNRGYWAPFWESLLMLAPEYFVAYSRFSSVPWVNGSLEPKVRELVYVAVDGALTHLYEPGLAVHAQNALRLGATVQEVIEVLELTSVIGIHAVTVGLPILIEELERLDQADASDHPGA